MLPADIDSQDQPVTC